MFSLKERLQQILIRDQIIREDDLQKALEEQKKNGGELSKILIKMKLVTEDDLTHALSEGLGMPPIDVSRLKIDPEVVKTIPHAVAQKNQIIPVSKMGDNLTLAMADPLNIFVIDSVKDLTGLNIIPIIGRSAQIQQTIERYYSTDSSETLKDIIKDIKDSSEDFELVREAGQMADVTVQDIIQDAPMIKLTDTIIQQSVVAKASDVFIEPMEQTLRIRYRVDGVIREVDQMTKALHQPIISRIKVISNLDISEHRLPQDGRFKTIVNGREVDFRVSVLPTAFGEKIVMRVLDKSSGTLDLEKLGFEERDLKRLREASLHPHGMILACGPTGSGKTTTLYSILKFVDSPEKNIVTVEDPVEYQVRGINQVNVKPSVGLTFSSALRSILRQDPDIILIGEIRDTETLDIAVKAALTGHLVLSSLHTTTAAGSVIRMMNMGVEPFLLCSSVLAISGQRLVRRICPHCKEAYELAPEMADRVGLARLSPSGKFRLYRGKGCAECMNTGYFGRVVISEILVLTPKVREFILKRAGELKIKGVGREEGMVTMREDGLQKAMAGFTSLEEVLRVTAPDEELLEQ
ncbi:MAG TPA: ATPase, T2SS/T4P/T4SS family [Candidatus Omnitrophota bacterium]|nr:ATPase, T2SS/T4P/T4SS family [Candidatus Omnitrophota bacterium]HSA30439.1 ATPase, T2SS/T4P/T4SS family [Candidatus Omnitrophota bacterium]